MNWGRAPIIDTTFIDGLARSRVAATNRFPPAHSDCGVQHGQRRLSFDLERMVAHRDDLKGPVQFFQGPSDHVQLVRERQAHAWKECHPVGLVSAEKIERMQ